MNVTAWVIGIGSGAPQQLTGEAIAAMNAVDLFLLADKGAEKRELTEIRAELCRAVIERRGYRTVQIDDPPRDRTATDYGAAVRRWHADRAARYREVITTELPGGGDVGFLVWGDPALYDSTIRIAESLAGPDLEVELRVVPGISSLQLLAAAHRIVLNQIGRPVHVTTGRRLLAEYTPELGDVVVMLDGELTGAELASRYPELLIFWGAQLGLPDEALVSGRLPEVIEEIRRVRARLRTTRGWVLDTYLLRYPE